MDASSRIYLIMVVEEMKINAALHWVHSRDESRSTEQDICGVLEQGLAGR